MTKSICKCGCLPDPDEIAYNIPDNESIRYPKEVKIDGIEAQLRRCGYKADKRYEWMRRSQPGNV